MLFSQEFLGMCHIIYCLLLTSCLMPPWPPTLPPWPPTFDMRASTFTMACNYTGFLDADHYSRFGIVDVDWSNNKEGTPTSWANQHPMDAAASLERQAAALKAAACPQKCPLPHGCAAKEDCPSTRVLVYRNIVKALPWFGSVRSKLENTSFDNFFIPFTNRGISNGSVPHAHVPLCDRNFDPPKCSSLYHDQLQTPQYPAGNLLDGTCFAPCDCGKVPCGEYIWDHRNGSMLQDWLLQNFLGGPTGLQSGNIDGFLLDDAWLPRHGHNGSIPGGPTEFERHAIQDMGLNDTDIASLYGSWKNTSDAAINYINSKGGWAWNNIQIAPCTSQSCCSSYLRSACTNTSVEQRLPMLFHWDAMNGHKQSRARLDSRQQRISSISEDFLFNDNGCKFVANTSVSNGNDVAHPFVSQSAQVCAQSCQNTNGCCVGLWNSANHKCYLKAKGKLFGPGQIPGVTAFNCSNQQCLSPLHPAPAPPPNPTPSPQGRNLTGLGLFLLARGPYAWIGHGWEGTCNFESPFPDELSIDFGSPKGLCQETETGIFTRQWTKSRVTVDCNQYMARIDMLGGEHFVGVKNQTQKQ